MTTPRKLAKNLGALTQLKEIWRQLPEDARDYWRERFVSSGQSQSEIRAELFKKLKVNLSYDSKLTQFRDWLARQDRLAQEGEKMAEDERETLDEHPDWTKEQVRDDVLKKAYFRARREGNFALGLKTVAADAKLESLRFERDRFEFDAAKAALAVVDQLRQIKRDNGLSDVDKINAARQALWGTASATATQNSEVAK